MKTNKLQDVTNEDLQCLYRLSLAIGPSVVIAENCRPFAELLITELDLDHVFIWLNLLPPETSNVVLQCEFASTEPLPSHGLSADNLFSKALNDKPYAIVPASRDLSKELTGTEKFSEGHFAAFRLDRNGLLLCFTHQLKKLKKLAPHLVPLMLRLSASLEGSLAYSGIKQAFHRLQQKEKEIEGISLLIDEDLHSVAKISRFGRLLYVNKKAASVIRGLNIEVGQKIPRKLLRFYQEILEMRGVPSFELFAQGAFYKFELVQAHDGSSVNIYGQDTTDRKLAEIALRDREAEHRLVLDNALEAVIDMDSRGLIKYWNPQAEHIFGWKAVEAVGQRLSDLIVPPDMRAAHEQGMRHYFKTGEGPVLNKRIEIHGQRKSGEIFPIELTVIPVKSKQETYFCSFLRDITEEKKNKEALEESENRYRTLVEAASDIIYQADHHGFCTYVNPIAAKMMKGTEEQLLGKHFTELLHPQYRQKVSEYYQEHFQQGKQPEYLEFPIMNLAGEEVWLGQNIQFIKNEDEIVGFTAVARDVTEKVLALNQLQRSEEKYRGIIENIHLGLLEVDLEDKIQYVNKAFAKMVGYSLDELKGKVAHSLLLNSKDQEILVNKNKERITGRSGAYEVRIKRKDDTMIWALISGAPLYNQYNEVVGSVGIHLDITKRKQAEEELEKALIKEKELNELKSRFVSMTSHEFRTPLTTIRTNAELIQLYLEREGHHRNQKFDKNFKRIDSEIHRLTALMDDVLTLGRIESGKIPYKPQNTDLVALCEKVIKHSFSNQEDGRCVELIVKGTPYEVCIDVSLTSHIISNLLSNAFKYSGGCENPELLLKFNEKSLSMNFKDHGIGIPPHEQTNLFSSFYRAENVGNIQGTGLGLNIVKHFLDIQGGTIKVRSVEGQGSDFKVSFPRKP